MRALISTGYGSPDVLQLTEVETPTPQAGDVLIRVRAAAVTSADTAFRKGEPFLIKLLYGLKKPKFAIAGVELAGEVVAVGDAVRRLKAGDAVFGVSTNTFGAWAEYKCLPESAVLVPKPANLSFAEAVAIADGAPTALTFLRDIAKVQPGRRVLINGASGAVGAHAVQFAKLYGAEVTAVCSRRNFDLVQALGADEMIDYTQEDFTRRGPAYDVVFDAVGKSSYGRCQGLLTPHGLYLTTVPTMGILAAMLRTAVGGRKAKFAATGLMQTQANFDYLRTLAESGQIRPILDRTYPLAEAADAHRYVDTERKRGVVVLTV